MEKKKRKKDDNSQLRVVDNLYNYVDRVDIFVLVLSVQSFNSGLFVNGLFKWTEWCGGRGRE